MFQAGVPCDFRVERIKHAVERVTEPPWRMQGRTDPETHYLSYCVEGAAAYTIENRPYRVSVGDLVFLPSGTYREGACDPARPWRFYSVGFTLAFRKAEEAEAFRGLPRVLSAPSLLPLFQELLCVWQGRCTGYLLGTRGLTEQVLYEVIRLATASEHNPLHYACVERVAKRMQADCTQAYDIDALAREAGFSTPYFRALFKRITGQSVLQYLNHVRVSQAKDLLRSGAANVTEAAYLTGFRDIYYFSRLFKRVSGQAPSHYVAKGERHHGGEHSV